MRPTLSCSRCLNSRQNACSSGLPSALAMFTGCRDARQCVAAAGNDSRSCFDEVLHLLVRRTGSLLRIDQIDSAEIPTRV